MNSRLPLWSVTASLAGFLLGLDTVVISGVEKTIQSLWGLGDLQHRLAMSSALWGTVFGSLIAGWPTDRFGRRTTFIVARLIGGISDGISTVAVPLYLSAVPLYLSEPNSRLSDKNDENSFRIGRHRDDYR